MLGPRLAPSQLCPGHTARHHNTGTGTPGQSSYSSHSVLFCPQPQTTELEPRASECSASSAALQWPYLALLVIIFHFISGAGQSVALQHLHAACCTPSPSGGRDNKEMPHSREKRLNIHFALLLTLHSKHRQTWLTCLLRAPHSRPGGAGGRV